MERNIASLVSVMSDKISYSVEEVSDKTSLSKAFLRLEIKRGKLKVKRFGRRVVICHEDLKEYIAGGSEGCQAA
jgi:excisionase family DNA binding protein